ncbi:MAG TPA: PP2C family protein-serine/threonine phosphatase [Acidimicrobiia bacterium]|nr:PP2C family protein-serine/threonine phosphatase [Acidimicrobiia bacterium]
MSGAAVAGEHTVDHRLPSVDGVEPPRPRRTRRRPLDIGAVVVLLIGILLTTAMTIAANLVNDDNEQSLLEQRTLEASTVLNGSLPTIRVPLATTAELAQGTGGDVAAVENILVSATGEGGPFVGAAVFERGNPEPIDVIGADLEVMARPAEEIEAMIDGAFAVDDFDVIGLLDDESPRLGYAYASKATGGRYVAYAEAALPPNRRQVIQRDSAFADLDYALYLGDRELGDALVISSVEDLPITGRRTDTIVAFGADELLFVTSPREHLGATILSWLPLALAVAGAILTGGAAALTERLLRQRERAESLAGELADLYANQRTIAEELQHSLLPQQLPTIPGLEIGVRYVPGVEGVDIGGDWYDVVEVDEHHVLLVVGDVSGRGIPAAAVMASLRYAIRAYAAQGDTPTTILRKLRALLDVGRDGFFATVLCGVVDVRTREITLANAGHPNALLVGPAGATFVTTEVATPIGVPATGEHGAVTVRIPDDATLLAFTDGLFERRGQTIDVGLEHLRDAAARHDGGLDELLGRVVADVVPKGSDDDIALLGVRWPR